MRTEKWIPFSFFVFIFRTYRENNRGTRVCKICTSSGRWCRCHTYTHRHRSCLKQLPHAFCACSGGGSFVCFMRFNLFRTDFFSDLHSVSLFSSCLFVFVLLRLRLWCECIIPFGTVSGVYRRLSAIKDRIYEYARRVRNTQCVHKRCMDTIRRSVQERRLTATIPNHCQEQSIKTVK